MQQIRKGPCTLQGLHIQRISQVHHQKTLWHERFAAPKEKTKEFKEKEDKSSEEGDVVDVGPIDGDAVSLVTGRPGNTNFWSRG